MERKEFHLLMHVDRRHTGDAAKAIVSTVLFHRLFGSFEPSTGESVGVTYPVVASDAVRDTLNGKQKEVNFRFREATTTNVHIFIKFYEKRARKNAWFQKTRTVCWETWHIELVAAPIKSETESSRRTISKDLQRVLMEILMAVDLNREHIPAITTTDLAPFPYEINIS